MTAIRQPFGDVRWVVAWPVAWAFGWQGATPDPELAAIADSNGDPGDRPSPTSQGDLEIGT